MHANMFKQLHFRSLIEMVYIIVSAQLKRKCEFDSRNGTNVCMLSEPTYLIFIYAGPSQTIGYKCNILS